MTKTKNIEERWEKEFDENRDNGNFDGKEGFFMASSQALKIFIRQTLQAQRKEIIDIIKKSKKTNLNHACKADNCSDPICGHTRCIDWMYEELLENLKK